MRAVVQRVGSARVRVDGRLAGEIGAGLLVFVGVGPDDGPADVRYVAGKIRDLRVFEEIDARGDTDASAGTPAPASRRRPMGRSVIDVGGQVLVVSQFTLYGDCRRGRRPSFDGAAAPPVARGLYDDLVRELKALGLRVETGEFQATMRVESVNDGPVTLLLESRRLF